MVPANRIVKNTGFLYGRMVITVFISLLTTRIVLNNLGVVDFGIFSVVGGAVAMLTFLNASMSGATQRFIAYAKGEGNPEKVKKVFNVSLMLHFGIALLVVVMLELFAFPLFGGMLKIPPDRIYAANVVYHFLVLSTFFSITTVPYDAVLSANENMFYYAILGVVESVLKLGVGVALVYSPIDKLILYGILMTLVSMFILVIMRVYCHKTYDECTFSPKKYVDKVLFKEMGQFAGWNLVGSASSMIAGYGSNIVLNHFYGSVLNATNAIAGQLNGQLLAFSSNMQKALTPIINKSEGMGDRNLLLKAAITGCKMSFLIFSFFCIPFLIETPFLLKLWLKTIPEWAVTFCRLAFIYTLIEQSTGTLGTAISAVGRIKQINILNSIIAIANIILLPIFLYYGKTPVVMPLLAIVVAILTGMVRLKYAKKFCSLDIKNFGEVLMKIAVVFLLSILLGLVPFLIMEPSIYRLILICMISMISLLLFTWVIALDSKERNIVNGLSASIITKFKSKNL